MAVGESTVSPQPGAAPGAPKAARRRVLSVVLGAVAGLVVLAAAALTALQFTDLAGPAGRIASRVLGRPVTVGSLRIGLGAPLSVALDDLKVANTPDGSRPDMVTLRHLAAEVAPWPLLAGRLEIRRLAVDAPNVMLERDAAGVGNWMFGSASKSGPAAPPGAGRDRLPRVTDLALHDGEVTFRTTSGNLLHIVLGTVAVSADGDQPVAITAEGAYNAFPITLKATGQPYAVLRDPAVPYGLDVSATSLGATVTFKGTMVDPLAVEGVHGAVHLDAPRGARVIAAAGLAAAADLGASVAATLDHAGDAWRLTGLKGRLGPDSFAGQAALLEGARGQPDHVGVDLAFRSLQLDTLLEGAAGRESSDPDALPVVEATPGTTIDAHLAAAEATQGRLQATDLDLRAAIAPGRITVDNFSLGLAGTRASLTGLAEPAPTGTHVTASAAITGADGAQLVRLLGVPQVGLVGRLDARASVDATGMTMSGALKSGRVSAVVAMRDGEVARSFLELASIDLRMLVRKSAGGVPLTCLLGVTDLRDGAGPVSPLRLRSDAGTLLGGGRIDAVKRTLDITLRTESATTGFFALDVPVRVSGPFADPKVRPAFLTENRTPVTPVDLGRLPPALQELARDNPCLR